MIIPHASLEPDTLNALLQEIVTRDGTDYGNIEATVELKIRQLKQALDDGGACLCFDAESETCNVIPADQAKALFGDQPDSARE